VHTTRETCSSSQVEQKWCCLPGAWYNELVEWLIEGVSLSEEMVARRCF
jgi:hypothetical protein